MATRKTIESASTQNSGTPRRPWRNQEPKSRLSLSRPHQSTLSPRSQPQQKCLDIHEMPLNASLSHYPAKATKKNRLRDREAPSNARTGRPLRRLALIKESSGCWGDCLEQDSTCDVVNLPQQFPPLELRVGIERGCSGGRRQKGWRTRRWDRWQKQAKGQNVGLFWDRSWARLVNWCIVQI